MQSILILIFCVGVSEKTKTTVSEKNILKPSLKLEPFFSFLSLYYIILLGQTFCFSSKKEKYETKNSFSIKEIYVTSV